MSIIIGIDVGGSTTKICGITEMDGKRKLIEPLCVSAGDPITSTYGAFGKFLDVNGFSLSDISKVMMTGIGASQIKRDIYGLSCERIPEFTAIGLGALYLSGLSSALTVSLGTGTAIVFADEGGKMEYLGGTGVGGGTLLGLSKIMTNADSIEHIVELAEMGSLKNIDLRIADVEDSASSSLPRTSLWRISETYPTLPQERTLRRVYSTSFLRPSAWFRYSPRAPRPLAT